LFHAKARRHKERTGPRESGKRLFATGQAEISARFSDIFWGGIIG
jgi:hypothetical protein